MKMTHISLSFSRPSFWVSFAGLQRTWFETWSGHSLLPRNQAHLLQTSSDRKIAVGPTFKSLSPMRHERKTTTLITGWLSILNGCTDSSILHMRRTWTA